MTEITITIDDEEARRKLDRLERELKEARREAEQLQRSTDRASTGGVRGGRARRGGGGRGGGGGIGSSLGPAAAAVATAALVATVVSQVVDAIGDEIGGPIGKTLQEQGAKIDRLIAEGQTDVTAAAVAADASGAFARGGTVLRPGQTASVFSESRAITQRETAEQRRRTGRQAQVGVEYVKAFLGVGGGE